MELPTANKRGGSMALVAGREIGRALIGKGGGGRKRCSGARRMRAQPCTLAINSSRKIGLAAPPSDPVGFGT